MKFNYNGLWKILIDKNMKKKDLIKSIGISPTTISKMTKGERGGRKRPQVFFLD